MPGFPIDGHILVKQHGMQQKNKHSTFKKILFHGRTMEWNLELFLPTVCTSPLMLLIPNTTVFHAIISPNTFKNENLCSNLNALLE